MIFKITLIIVGMLICVLLIFICFLILTAYAGYKYMLKVIKHSLECSSCRYCKEFKQLVKGSNYVKGLIHEKI